MNSIIFHIFKSATYAGITSLILSTPSLAVPAQVPLQSKIAGATTEPNVMIFIDTSWSMAYNVDNTSPRRSLYDPSPSNHRMHIAKEAAKSIISNTDNVRFCLATFDQAKRARWPRNRNKNIFTAHGAYINENRQCGTDKAVLIEEIDNIYEGWRSPNQTRVTGPIDTILGRWAKDAQFDNDPRKQGATDSEENYAFGTPTASAIYDLTRYFKGQDAWPGFGLFEDYSEYTDPLISECQQNVVIILTDGFSVYDWTLERGSPPPPLPSDTAAAGQYDSFAHSLPRWADDYPINEDEIPNKTNSFCRANSPDPSTSTTKEPSACMDDLALYAHQIDLKTGSSDGINWDTPPFEKQTLDIHTIGLGYTGAILRSTASLGGGTYTTVGNQIDLENAFNQILSGVAKVSGNESDSSVSGFNFFSNPGGIDFFISTYDTDGWFGELFSYKVEEDANGNINSQATLNWKASEHIPSYTTRALFTHNNGTAVTFDYDNLTASQQLALGTDQALAEQVVDYIKGDITNEESQSGAQIFRDRTRTIDGVTTRNILGDIVHANPVFIHQADFGYPEDDYADYLANDKPSTRDAMIYVGSNDGILHAVNAETGTEEFGFIPATLFPKLATQSGINFGDNHQLYIDGTATGTDAQLDGDWKSVYASPFGAGAKGLFLLDIDDPNQSIGNIFKWEINENTLDGSATPYENMGFIINQTKITRVKDSGGQVHWVLITGNGVHSENGAAEIYVINLDDGTLFQDPIVLDSGFNTDNSAKYTTLSEGNGVTEVAAAGINTGTFTDTLYAATLKGNVWRLDYEPGAGSDGKFETHFGSESNPEPLFSATSPDTFDYDRDGDTSEIIPQAITGGLTITRGPGSLGGQLISFGTGRYFEHADINQENNLKIQSFYTIWDRDQSVDTGNLTRTELQQQTIESQFESSGSTNSFRKTSSNTVDWETKRGWYLDLKWDFGERIIASPNPLFDRISIQSIVPSKIIQDVHNDSPISDTFLENSNGGINANECNVDASGAHGWVMQLDRATGAAPDTAVFSLPGANGVGVSGESWVSPDGSNSITIQKTDGTTSLVTVDETGKTTEIESGAQYQRTSWRRLQ